MSRQCHVNDGRIQQFDNDPSYLDGSSPFFIVLFKAKQFSWSQCSEWPIISG